MKTIGAPTHTKVRVICLRHAHESEALLTDDQIEMKTPATCPKCSQRAVPMTLIGLAFSVPAIIRDVSRLREAVHDLECAAEEREIASTPPHLTPET